VGTDGFVSAERIANAHDAALRNTSFTIRHREVRIRNGTVDHREVGTLRYDGDGAVYYNYLQSFRARVTGYSRLGGEPTVRVSAAELARSGSADGSRRIHADPERRRTPRGVSPGDDGRPDPYRDRAGM
jgi:hypothetical protein